MELNCLLGTVLRSLDFDVYSTGARVNEAAQPVVAKKGRKGPRHNGWYISSDKCCHLANRVRGESELVATLSTEDRRVQALEKYLHVKPSEPELLGIQGMITQLSG